MVKTRGPRWWQWPTVLSLDAPAVAVAWQGLLAKEAGARPGAAAAAILAISVWLSYMADRWLEGWRLVPESVRTQRLRFHQLWRWPIAAAWLAALAIDVMLALRELDARQFAAGATLLIPVLMYVVSHQVVHRDRPWRLPKEMCVALLLCGGALVFVIPRTPAGHGGRLAIPAALFALLCFANCALISVWERSVDWAHGQTSLARQFRSGSKLGEAAPWAPAILGAAAAVLFPALRPAGICAAASGLLLAGVDWAEPKWGREIARVLADAVLLTPVPWLIWSAGRGGF